MFPNFRAMFASTKPVTSPCRSCPPKCGLRAHAFQLQDKLAELLQTNGLVSTPQVSVTLKEQHSQPITVIGAVKTPMVIQAMRKITLLQALVAGRWHRG